MKLFNKKEKVVQPAVAWPVKYKMGYYIQLKNKERLMFSYSGITNRDELRPKIEAMIQNMSNELNLAVTNKQEFVKLQNNVIRLNDVEKVVMYEDVEKEEKR